MSSQVRLLVLVSLFLALAIAPLSSGVAQGQINDSLVAYWSFDSDFTATFGGSIFDGNPINGPSIDASVQKFGSTAWFDSTNQEYLQITSPVIEQGQDHTYSAWYRLNVDDITGSTRFFVLETYGGGGYAASYGLRDLGSGDVGQVFTQSVSGTSAQDTVTGAGGNQWHNIIVTYDADNTGAEHTIYLDGSFVTTMASFPLLKDTEGLIIGGHRDGMGRNWDGWIDDVAFWNRVLTAEEISDLQSNSVADLMLPAPVDTTSFRPFYFPDRYTLHTYPFFGTNQSYDYNWYTYTDRELTSFMGNLTSSFGVNPFPYPLRGLEDAWDVGAGNDSIPGDGDGDPTNNGHCSTDPATPFYQSELQGPDGAFTYEALITTSRITSTTQEIINHNSSTSPGFRFFIYSGQLYFQTGGEYHGFPIPTTGDHAFVPNQWYHVAVTYDGNEGQPDNLKFYWTRLQEYSVPANLIGSASRTADVPNNLSALFIGADAYWPYRLELQGKVDEVRISSIARDPDQFLTSLKSRYVKGMELCDALGLDPEWIYSTTFDIQQVPGVAELIPEANEQAAAPGPFEGSVLITTGKAADEGLGSTDWRESNPDHAYFSVNLLPPAWARSIHFTTQFITREFEEGRPGNDRAEMYFGDYNRPWGDSDLDEVVGLTAGSVNPPVTHAIEVPEILPTLGIYHIDFRVEESGDGQYDSGLLISNMYFSAQPLPADAACDTSGVFCYIRDPEPHNTGPTAGTYTYSSDMLTVAGPSPDLPLYFAVQYNSESVVTGALGPKWTHSYEIYVRKIDTGDLIVTHGNGEAEYFEPDGGGGYQPRYGGTYSTIVENPDGTFTYHAKTQLTYQFDVPVSGGAVHLLGSITDANGNTFTLSYNPQGQLVSVDDTRPGCSLDFTYDAGGYLIGADYNVSSSPQWSATFEHHPLTGDLTSFSDNESQQTSFNYDARSRLLTATDNDGVRFASNTYFADMVWTHTDGKGATRTVNFEAETMEVTDREGESESSRYDVRGRRIMRLDRTGEQWDATYDSDDNVTSATDPRGARTRMSYDDRGNLTGNTNALGQTDSMVYDTRSNLVRRIDARNEEWEFDYNGSDNLLSEIDPLGRSTDYTYTTTGQVETVTDKNGNTTSFVYTPQGDVDQEVDPYLKVTRYSYDPLGRRLGVEDPNLHRTTYEYDGAGRVTAEIDALSQRTEYTYDAQGRLLTATSPNTAVTEMTYTATGQVHESIDPLDHTTTNTYDGEDRLLTTTDPMGRVTSFAYDAEGRLTSVTDPAGNTTQAVYDEAGNRTHVTDPKGNTTTYSYDPLGRVIGETDPLGRVTTYVYDARGSLTSLSRGGKTIGYSYDDTGRLVGVTMPEGSVVHTLDNNGNSLSSACGTAWASVTRTFDKLDRPLTRTDEFGNTVGYTYDDVGNLAVLTYSDGKTVTYGYDALDRLTTVTDWSGNITTYSYDAVSNLIGTVLPDSSTVTYGYDLAGRLTGITDTSPHSGVTYSVAYTLDDAGNPTTAVVDLPLPPAPDTLSHLLSYNSDNELRWKGTSQYTYDAMGNMVSGVIDETQTTMTYNSLGQLVSYGSDTYRYDVDGLRVKATRGGETTRCVYDPTADYTQLLEEHDDGGNIIARYVYGIGLISREDSLGTLSVYHLDSRGSTVALTDSTGTVTGSYAYDPYGNLGARSGETGANPFTFCGAHGVVDDGNGLYYMRQRYYAPELMRFIQKDLVFTGTISVSGSLNRHTYVMGNPILHNDPNGDVPSWLSSAWNWTAEKGKSGADNAWEDTKNMGTMFKDSGVALYESILAIPGDMKDAGQEMWGDITSVVEFGNKAGIGWDDVGGALKGVGNDALSAAEFVAEFGLGKLELVAVGGVWGYNSITGGSTNPVDAYKSVKETKKKAKKAAKKSYKKNKKKAKKWLEKKKKKLF